MDHEILFVRTGDLVSVDVDRRDKQDKATDTINYPSDWRDRRNNPRSAVA